MIAVSMATRPSMSVARPLRTLVPIIKNDLARGDKEAVAASQPYYERAGLALIEAARSDDLRGASQFWDWAVEATGRRREQIRAYMQMALENNDIVLNSISAPVETVDDLLRATRKHYPQPSSNMAKKAISDTLRHVNQKEYAHPAAVTRPENERTLRNKLALQLIDIGYKTLAVKLHPDKNKQGSSEAMVRLNAVRVMLKNAVR